MRTVRKDLVTKMAYMFGVRDDYLESRYKSECPDVLEEIRNSKEARIIRILNTIRSTMIQRFTQIDNALRYELKNLDRIDLFNSEDIKWLESEGIKLIQVNTNLEKYLVIVNQLISVHINNCKHLIPSWVVWEYIKDLFVIPRCTANNEETAIRSIKDEYKKYQYSYSLYPYQLYIHWSPYDCGNILSNDKKFLTIIYGLHNSEFSEYNKVMDATDETKNNIYSFIDSSLSAAIIVDCENSDVYKLYSVLKNLDNEKINKIKKIILYDDIHTIKAWRLLENFVDIEVEHINVERITDKKSLVDMQMAVGACKEFYEHNISSFILVSSDSDFWPLISSLNKAEFLVMIEYDKCGEYTKRKLRENNIYYCSIDDFCAGNIYDIKVSALTHELQSIMSEFNKTGIMPYLNRDELVNQIYNTCRIEPTPQERKRFVDNYVGKIKLITDKDGTFRLDIAQ